MKNLILILSILTPLYNTANAQTFRIGAGQSWAVAFPDDGAKFLPSKTVLGVGVAFPVVEGLGWHSEIGISIPTTALKPNPRVFTGPVVKLSEQSLLSITLLYEPTPPYNDEWKHLIGLSVTPGVKINETTSLLFLFGVGKLVDGPWSLAFKPTISFKLPW